MLGEPFPPREKTLYLAGKLVKSQCVLERGWKLPSFKEASGNSASKQLKPPGSP